MNIQEIIKEPNAWLAIPFLLAFIIQMYFYLGIYIRVAFYKIFELTNNKLHPLSIVICARNEENNLQQNLPAILDQLYPEYEVIVVNDASEDNTEEVLSEYKKKYHNLKVTSLPVNEKFTHGKKLALTVGIKAAKHEWIVFTDADCKPESKNWLKHMSQQINNKVDFVLGYGPYSRSRSLLNNYIRYDTFFIALQYMGYALNKNPYMGIGRNLAYRKEIFFKNKGFGKFNYMLSGDDDLFVNSVANKNNTTVCIHPDTFMYSKSAKNFGKWWRQKKRHLTTYKHYRPKHKFSLGLEVFSRVVFYLFFIILLTLKFNPDLIVSIFGIRFIAQFIIFGVAQRKLKEKNLMFTSIIFDILAVFINFSIELSNRLTRKNINGGTW